MARVNQIITDFSTGEISPLSEGRVNTTQYQSACRVLENFTVSARGGVKRRGGMHYINKTKNGQPARLIPFIFNREQSYVMEFGHKYIRFHRTDGTVGNWVGADGRSGPDKFGDTLFRRYLQGPEARAWVEEFVPYEIASPWTIDQVWDLHFAQANDVMIIVHQDVVPKRLERIAENSWAIQDPAWTSEPWVRTGNVSGYPRTVVFFQQRLWFGGSKYKPQTLWASRVADFYNFTVSADPDVIAPDDSLELAIAAYTQEKIEWLSSEKSLIIGTTGSEQRLTPDQYVSVDNVPNIARMTSYGGRHIQPVYIGELTIFIQGTGRQVRSYTQNTKSIVEQYSSKDLAWFAEHITKSGITEISYELVPDSIFWAVREDGNLISMTHDPSLGEEDYSAMGWSRHPTDGSVISVTTIPNYEYDETWVCTKRGTTHIVEYMNPALFTDSCLTTPEDSEDELTVVGGLDHLIGKEVQVVVDGAVQNTKVVDGSGQVTLDRPGKLIEVGLPYVSKLETTKYNSGNDSTTNLGTAQRWAQVYIKIVDSALPLVNGVRPSARTPSTPMGLAEEIRSGDYNILGLGWDPDGTIIITQDIPKPTQLVAVYGIYQSNVG